MSLDRDEEIIAAYAAGEDLGHIERRFGISASEIRRIVATETEIKVATDNRPSAQRPRVTPSAAAGIVLIAIGLVGPCAGGILWLAVYYLSETAYPVSSWQEGNLAVGLSGMCAGSVLTVTGVVLLLVARSQRRDG
ncbi:cell division protein CrgA [Micromonospora maris]|uniref:cell division protein CrgA n=1 Tax=Micromonospora maris TaxID=1003110 RepID=UPI002E15D77A|nr:cell division protein CrgA [Micromonospora maris]